ncbi:hypothetical protein Bca52824_038883 [Brassica carinata]|uniref:Uncharacterized protein n=1 Tax=Brassica carinata TaxID=52824 RepID=A0A8X7UVD8_BRACI|nr:hypothetical protein Bca52824_038883 [Brassica carinata]
MNGIHHTKRLEGDDLVHVNLYQAHSFIFKSCRSASCSSNSCSSNSCSSNSNFSSSLTIEDVFSYTSFEAVGYDFNTIELSQLEQRKRSSLLLTQVHQGTNGLRSLAGSVRCLATLKWDWSRNN